MFTVDKIIEKSRIDLADLNEKRIRLAFDYAVKMHKDQYRFSGDAYIDHLLAVAEIMITLKPTEDTLIAILLHDLFDSKNYNLKEVVKLFGEDVGFIISNFQKVSAINFRVANASVESLRKMFLSVAGDLRVITICLANCLHNMNTLDFVVADERKAFAREALDIYVPIAARLGIYKIKWQLEDLSFKYLHPESYNDLKVQLEDYVLKQEKVVDFIKTELQIFLKEKKIEATVEGRLKNLYSIYKKLKAKNSNSLNEIFDIFALRVILPSKFNEIGGESVSHLYDVLSLIHKKWPPVSNKRFKDYVAMPKGNGYRSIHTLITGITPKLLNQPAEIQIRSQKMHDEADFGFASHWFYKENKGFQVFKKPPSGKDWLEGLDTLKNNLKNGDKSKSLKIDLFKDRIFVLTPFGDVKDLPMGSTPIDFAYSVHTDVGHSCYGAKVNGRIVPLNYKLKNGEVVKILTKNKFDPKLQWLSFAVTINAKNKIKSYFTSSIERNFRDGKDLLNKKLEEMGEVPLDENLSILKIYGSKKLSLKERETLVQEVGKGIISPITVIKKVFGERTYVGSMASKKIFVPKTAVKVEKKFEEQIFIAGETDVPYKFSSCCKPNVGSPIVAYVSRGSAVRIHSQNCKFLKNSDSARILEASFGQPHHHQNKYPVKILIKAFDRVGLIRDIAEIVASFNMNILDFSMQVSKGEFVSRNVTLEVSNEEQFKIMLNKLSQIRNVLKVEKAI